MSNKKLGVGILSTIAAFLILLIGSNAAPQDNFSVSFDENVGLDHVCFDITIINNEETDDIPFKAILNDTNIDVSKTNVRFYEWKTEELEEIVNDYCLEWVIDEKGISPDGSLFNNTGYNSVLCGSHVEYYEESRWEPRGLMSTNEDVEKGEISNQFEEVTIVKNKPKKFRLCYDFSDIKAKSHGFMYFEAKDTLYFDFEHSSFWNSSWGYYRNLTIDHNLIDSALTDYPLYVELNSDNYTVQADWDDIRFVSGSGSVLDYEFDNYTTTGTAWHVRIPSVSSTVDTVISVYYNNPTATDGSNATGVWDSNYQYVTHMNDIDGADSTQNNEDFNHSGGVTMTEGKLGNATDFDGTDGYIDMGVDKYEQQIYTVETWWAVDAISGNYEAMWSTSGIRLALAAKYTGNFTHVHVSAGTGDDTTEHNVAPVAGTWYYSVGGKSGNGADQTKTWLDGIEIGSKDVDAIDFYNHVGFYTRIGYGYTNYFNGQVDELRISNVLRSGAYVNATYNNHNSPLTFYTIGTEEIEVAAGADEFYNITLLSPANETITNDNTPDFIFRYNGTFGDASCRVLNGTHCLGINASTLNSTTTTITSNTTLSDGSMYWWVNCTNATTSNISDQNWTLSVDTVVPVVTFLNPTPDNASIDWDGFYVNVSVSETADTCYAEINTTNYTMSAKGNDVYQFLLAGGSHEDEYRFIVYCNDSADNLGISDMRWVTLNWPGSPGPVPSSDEVAEEEAPVIPYVPVWEWELWHVLLIVAVIVIIGVVVMTL